MKLIVGLGNPGEKYQHNRHNVGFMVADCLAAMVEGGVWREESKFKAQVIKTASYILVKPSTFMNESGKSVSMIARFYQVKYADLYIVHDDLDIELGSYKIQHAKGPRIHYGVNSVEAELGTEDFWRVRVGVENREIRGNKGVAGEKYSLQDFSQEESRVVERVIEKVVDELKRMVF